jgi:ribosomal protein S18 acetylase RimI-like enzyme
METPAGLADNMCTWLVFPHVNKPQVLTLTPPKLNGFTSLPGIFFASSSCQKGESSMSVITTVIGRLLTVRPMEPTDLPRLLMIEKQRLGNRLIRQDSPIQMPDGDHGIWVAAIHSVIVGYLVYQLIPAGDWDEGGSSAGSKKPSTGTAVESLCVVLRHLYVTPDWQRRGIGRALIERFAPKLPHQQESYSIQAAVPETNLPVQLLLRSAGYRAMRVLRNYLDDEDAYLMERRRS